MEVIMTVKAVVMLMGKVVSPPMSMTMLMVMR